MKSGTRIEQLRHALGFPLAESTAAERTQDAAQAIDWVLAHFATLAEQPIGRTASRAQMEALLREPPPEEGQPFARVFADFQERVVPNAFRVNHPRFVAFVPGSPTFASILGDWLCAGTNFFAGVWLEAAGPAQVEEVVLDWFKEILGYPTTAAGLLTSGGSEANLTALVVARECLRPEERSQAVLYGSAQRHASVDRAARVIGLLPHQLRAVPTDAHWRVQAEALRHQVEQDRMTGLRPWAVVANAGATSTGTVDPLASLAAVCREQGLWFHVDAAYGWPAVLGPATSAVLDGIAQADSITLDPHKWLGQTFEAGCLLVREGGRLPAAFALHPDYMQDVEPAPDEINFADRGLALTRRFRALKVWLSIKVLGLRWFRNLVDRCCQLAELAEALLERSAKFEILCPRQLSIVCFRYAPAGRSDGTGHSAQDLDQLNLALVKELRATGRAFLSSTRLGDCAALRLCFVNWRTTSGDVEEIIQLLESIGNRLWMNRASWSTTLR